MSSVALQDARKVFPDGTIAVDGVSFDVADGEFMVLLGPSGCGKSTLLRMIAGLEVPTSGSVRLDDVLVHTVSPQVRRVAMVFQDYALYPHMSVQQNIDFPLLLAGVEPGEREERVADVALALGIGELVGRRPEQLSGGQRQRVAMARAIVRQPAVFLMDEPLSNLDSALRAELRAEIAALTKGVTTVYVTHDQSEAMTMADRVAILRKGVLQDIGTPAQVYNRPATLYVATFLGIPRMSVFQASVHVHLDRYVALQMGEQALHVPWMDMRARSLAHFHGEQIVVGLRSEALSPTDDGAPGAQLRGRVRYLEHHGHESLAYLDIGARAAHVDDIYAAAESSPGSPGPGRLTKLAARLRGRSEAGERSTTSAPSESVPPSNGLVVRVPPYPGLKQDDPLTVFIDISAVHFFDLRGDRIDVGRR